MRTSVQIRPSWTLPTGRHSTVKHCVRPSILNPRHYATQSSSPGRTPPSSSSSRKQVTMRTDDGRVQWGELSKREKAARSTQQSVNFMVILVGAVMTGGVFTLLYTNVFSPQSKTSHFNNAVSRVKGDSRCIQLLGDSKQIRAYGESTWNRWTRNRPVATTISKDKQEREHLKMHFHVSGPLNDGRVSVHMIKPPGHHEYQYHLLAVDIQGHSRIYLENAEAAVRAERKKASTIFGIRWR